MAIGRNEISGAITIAKDKCIGCGACIEACASRAVFFDDDVEKAYKCDLCSGEPECVRYCASGASTFGEVKSEIEANYWKMFEEIRKIAEEESVM